MDAFTKKSYGWKEKTKKGDELKKIVHKAKSHKEAEVWDVIQQIMMSAQERQHIARELKKRFYGNITQDIRGKKK